MKTAIIGDIHGYHRALTTMLRRLRLDEGADRLILLGDLFDRGPESWEVFQTVQRLAVSFGPRFTLLLGNHEDYLLQPRLTLARRWTWERVGRSTTVKSFGAHGARMEDAIPWLKEHCQLFYREASFQCVHAGILKDPIEENDRETLIHSHDAVPLNQYAGPLTITGHIAVNEPTYFAGDEAHTEILPCGEWRELPQRGVICIDTGCGKGGRLTAMVVEEGHYMLEGAL